MKHLLLFFLFSGSLDSFSQAITTSDSITWAYPIYYSPDTLRATLIVYYDRGPAFLHTKPGFVVRRWGKDDVYLDDRKKVIRNLEVFSYKLKK